MASNPEDRGDYAELWSHLSGDVGYLISSTRSHHVFIDKVGSLDWETTRQYDLDAPSNTSFNAVQRNCVLSDAALLEATPCDGISRAVCQDFKRLIGEAIVRMLEFDYIGAQKMIVAARQFIKARSEETSRRWYVVASFSACLLFAAIGLAIWLLRASIEPAIGGDGIWLALSGISGAFGAFLSVLTRAGKLKFDSVAGRPLHIVEGASRIVAGAISGVLVALAVKSGIILSALTRDGQLHDVMALAALVGGSGERLVTSIISKFESAHADVGSMRQSGEDKEGTNNG